MAVAVTYVVLLGIPGFSGNVCFLSFLCLCLLLFIIWQRDCPVCAMSMAFPWMFGVLYKLTVSVIIIVCCLQQFTDLAAQRNPGSVESWQSVVFDYDGTRVKLHSALLLCTDLSFRLRHRVCLLDRTHVILLRNPLMLTM